MATTATDTGLDFADVYFVEWILLERNCILDSLFTLINSVAVGSFH